MAKQSCLMLFFALAISLCCTVSYALPQTAANDLGELEQRLARAWVQNDQAAIDAILADDWTVIDIFGQVRTKTAVFRDMLGSQNPQIKDMTIDDVDVRLLGDVAVITGRTTVTGSDGITVRLRFTDVAVHHNDRWKIVASQGTRIAQ